MTAQEMKEYLERLTQKMLRKAVAVPLAVGLAAGLPSCELDTNDTPAELVTKQDVQDNKYDDPSDYCLEIGAEPGCDICAEQGWYGDGDLISTKFEDLQDSWKNQSEDDYKHPEGNSKLTTKEKLSCFDLHRRARQESHEKMNDEKQLNDDQNQVDHAHDLSFNVVFRHPHDHCCAG